MRGPPVGFAKDPARNFGSRASVALPESKRALQGSGMMAVAALVVYQRVLSPTKGRSCPMYPSCSAFAMRSVRKYGVGQGALMAADRLHRCGHDLKGYTKEVVHGDLLHLDFPEDRAPQSYAR